MRFVGRDARRYRPKCSAAGCIRQPTFGRNSDRVRVSRPPPPLFRSPFVPDPLGKDRRRRTR